METSDRELLQTFLGRKSEEAFRQLVERHLAMVLGTARRMLGNEQAAEEVAQNTFALLAKKAASLTPEQSLGGWLHRAARNECLHVQRAEGRRRQREETAVAMNAIEQTGTPPELLGDLEEALEELAPEEHDALVLRYLEDRKLHEVGTELGVSEDAARMRVNRALDRLRAIFEQRGISISAGALVAALTGQAAVTVPAGMGAAIATTVLTQSTVAAATAGGGTVTAWLTLKSVAVITSVVAVTSAGLIWYQQDREPEAPVVAQTTAAAPASNVASTSAPMAAQPAGVATGLVNQSAGNQPVNAAIPAAGSEKPPTPEARRLVDEARGLIERQRFEDARALLDRAAEQSTGFAEIYLWRGKAFDGMDKFNEAELDFGRALEIRPAYKEAYFERSRIHEQRRNYFAAIHDCTQALNLDVDFWQAWLARGRAYYLRGEYDNALADLDAAIHINPDFAEGYQFRANIHERWSQWDEAIANRQAVAKLNSGSGRAWYELGVTLAFASRYREAISAYDQAAELEPDLNGPHRSRGYALFALGEYTGAISNFTEAIRTEPGNHFTFAARSRAWAAAGNMGKAIEDIDRAIRMAPEVVKHRAQKETMLLQQPTATHERKDE